MREAIFPEFIQLKAPEGMQEAIREAAREEGQTASEFVRQAIRARLRGAEQQAAAGT